MGLDKRGKQDGRVCGAVVRGVGLGERRSGVEYWSWLGLGMVAIVARNGGSDMRSHSREGVVIGR